MSQPFQGLRDTIAQLRAFSRRKLPHSKPLGRADRQLALWMFLCLGTLVPSIGLMLGGGLSPFVDAQVRMLASHPFHMSAEEAQISFLSPTGTFFLCLLPTLWLAAVLLREHRYTRRCQVAFLAALAMALPGLLCVLWGGVLEVAAPLLCIALLWAYTVPLSALGRLLHRAYRIHRIHKRRA